MSLLIKQVTHIFKLHAANMLLIQLDIKIGLGSTILSMLTKEMWVKGH